MKPRRATEQALQGAVALGQEDLRERMSLLSEELAMRALRRVSDPRGPMCFVDFAAMLDVELSLGQRTIARTIYDGLAPEGELAEQLFGGVTEAPTRAQMKVALTVAGRGSGKTSRLLSVRALHLALTARTHKLMKGEPALVPVVAPDQRQSLHTLSFVKGLLENRPAIASALKYDTTTDVIRIVRPDGVPVTIEARPATAGGRAVRGPSLAGVILEEAAFFYGEGYEVSDQEIYRAARPRLMPGAQIAMGTTPWARAGLVWEFFRENFGTPKRAIVARAPTLIMRPDEETAEMVRLEREADPENAARELDAEFLSADAERFFPDPLIERCIDDALQVLEDGRVVRHMPDGTVLDFVIPGQHVRPGGDFAFDADASALTVFVERERFDLCEIAEDRPTPGGHLVPSEVVGKYAKQIARAGGRLIVADAHYRRAIEEHLTAKGLALTGPPSNVPADNFLVVRALMAADRVRIPRHSRLLKQLALIRSAHRPGGQISILLPRGRIAGGGHCDIVSAMVCSLSGIRVTSRQAEPPPASRAEAEARAEKAAQRERLRQIDDEKKKREGAIGRRFARLLPRALLRQLRG